ncbi:MAG: hypothetical protein OXI81_11410 [Paracoccaceae bacterium]|nr:hypothetical protein [Paracoccaceae bacterium]MDE2915584.1 hypothetical protein [Paracoccaceae bacterium]
MFDEPPEFRMAPLDMDPRLTVRAIEIAYVLAYRSLDVDSRRVLAVALPRLVTGNTRPVEPGLGQAVFVSISECCMVWGLDDSVAAAARLSCACVGLQAATVPFRWYQESGSPGIIRMGWLASHLVTERPWGAGLIFTSQILAVAEMLLREIRSDPEPVRP